MLNRTSLLLAFALSLAFGLPAAAQPGSIVVEAAWARATPPGVSTAAGYLTIRNTGDGPDRLISAAAERAGRVELHETTLVDGVARMRPRADGVAIAPGEAVVFAPGGLHLMFREMQEGLSAGEAVPVTLTFERAGEREVAIQVVPIGADPPNGGHDAGHDGPHDAGHGDAGHGAHR